MPINNSFLSVAFCLLFFTILCYIFGSFIDCGTNFIKLKKYRLRAIFMFSPIYLIFFFLIKRYPHLVNMPFSFGWKYWKIFGSWCKEAFGILCWCHCRWTSQSKGYFGGTLLLLLLQPTVGFGSIGVRSTTRNSFGFLCFILLPHHILEREKKKSHSSPVTNPFVRSP